MVLTVHKNALFFFPEYTVKVIEFSLGCNRRGAEKSREGEAGMSGMFWSPVAMVRRHPPTQAARRAAAGRRRIAPRRRRVAQRRRALLLPFPSPSRTEPPKKKKGTTVKCWFAPHRLKDREADLSFNSCGRTVPKPASRALHRALSRRT